MTSLPILTYHRLLSGEATREADPKRIAVSAAQFRSHLAWLKRLGYSSFPLQDYPRYLREGRPLPSRSVGITFDDGYVDVLTLGLPVLQEFGMTATIFAVSAELDGVNRWDDGAARLMSIPQYQQWAKAGMGIGAHTRHHVHLPRVSADVARDELAGCKKDLESALGHPITLLAYPYGETDDAVDLLAQEAGYEAAFATDQAPIDHAGHLYRLRRAVVFPKNSTLEIILKSQTWYTRYQQWKRGRRGK